MLCRAWRTVWNSLDTELFDIPQSVLNCWKEILVFNLAQNIMRAFSVIALEGFLWDEQAKCICFIWSNVHPVHALQSSSIRLTKARRGEESFLDNSWEMDSKSLIICSDLLWRCSFSGCRFDKSIVRLGWISLPIIWRVHIRVSGVHHNLWWNISWCLARFGIRVIVSEYCKHTAFSMRIWSIKQVINCNKRQYVTVTISTKAMTMFSEKNF